MDKRAGLQSTTLRIEDVPTVRSMVAQKLREAIMSGTFKPGQRLVERELCEMTGVSRPSIREALRLLEADGLVTTVAHRGPVVSTISLEEAKQIYAARAVLEGFAGREFARLHDPAVGAGSEMEIEASGTTALFLDCGPDTATVPRGVWPYGVPA